MQRLRSFVQGQWVDGASPHSALHNAVTGEVCAETSTRGIDRGAALAWAREVGGGTLRAMTFTERGVVLKAMSKIVYEHRDELIALSTENYGATRGDGKFDVDGASATLAYYASQARKLGDRTLLIDGEPERIGRSSRFVGYHLVSPRRGVALHINAFNFPAWGMCEKLAVSLLAGMPALVKPGTSTSLVTWRIVELWDQAGVLPAGSVSLLCGSVGDLLDHVDRQDCIAFTGSAATGVKIRGHERVLELGVPVNVEADSLNAHVLGPDVDPDSDTFEMFVSQVFGDITQKAGQKCTAVRRVFVPSDLLEDVQEAFADKFAAVTVGDPNVRGTDLGPVSTEAQQRDVLAGIASLERICEPFASGGEAPATGFYVTPRMFLCRDGLEAEMVHDEEVFGPVCTVLPWSGDADELVALVARGGGGLVCSLYSNDSAWATTAITGLAPWHGRIHWGSHKVVDQSPGPGTVLPNLIHGGPGKAGGGQELGGLRGLSFYQQRTAVQADRALFERAFVVAEG